MPNWLWESRSNKFLFTSAALSGMIWTASTAHATVGIPEDISPEYVFENFSKRGLRLENLQLRARSTEAQIGALQGLYDPELGIQLGSEISRAESLSGLNNLEDQTLIFGSSLKKTFSTGTNVELQYSYTQQDSRLNPFTSSLRSSSVVENRVTLIAKQNLIYNALGGSQRLKIAAAERSDEAQKLFATEQSEELLLQNLSQFWVTYKSYERLQLALEARKIYEELLNSAKEKRRLGLADAGDLARAEAGLEAQQQKVKASSAQYLSETERFFDFMDESVPEGDPVFKIPTVIPPAPSNTEVDGQALRLSKISQMQLDALDAERGSYKLEDLPLLNVVGEASWNGVDSKASRSFSETLSAKRPRYYLGLEFGFRFGNSGTRSKIGDIMNRYQIQKNEQALTQRAISMNQRAYTRQLSSAYQIAISARKAKENYRTLLAAQKRNYRQGRIDLSLLIQDYNLMFESELAAIEAFGNYHILLHEWAAFKDQLFTQKAIQ